MDDLQRTNTKGNDLQEDDAKENDEIGWWPIDQTWFPPRDRKGTRRVSWS